MWLDDCLNDLRYAGRTFQRAPGFAIAVVTTLALAIGANTAIFSLISFTLLEPLPFPGADQIVQFWFTTPAGSSLTLSIPEVNALMKEADVFEDVAAYDFSGPGISLTGIDHAVQVKALHVSAAYFHLFGAPFEAGRAFIEDEDKPTGGRVAILGNTLWRRHFGADRSLVGKTISLGNEPYLVTGILEADFQPDPPAEIWLPLQANLESTGQAHFLRAAGRLRNGVTIEQANAKLTLIFAEFRKRFPLINPKAGLQAKPLRETNTGDLRSTFLVLFGTVIAVLLIACSNVTNLLMARAAARRQEMAIRAAIGASRRRLGFQLLTECMLLAIAGGVLGLLLGRNCLRGLLAVHPEAVPGIDRFAAASLDWRVLLFTVAVSIGTTLLCGLLPALRASRANLIGTIQDGGRTGGGPGATSARAALVVFQGALAVVLLVGAGLMIRTFAALRQVDTGLDTHRILTLQMSLQGTKFQDTAAVSRLVTDGVDRLQSVPGVVAAASAWTLPVELAFGSSFIIEGRPLGNEVVHGPALMRPVSSQYTAVFGIPLIRGRFFTSRDTASAPGVAVISDAMARKFWPNGNPIGERITVDKYLGPDFAAGPREIIGVATDVRDLALNKEPGPMIYLPQAQMPDGMTRIDVGILPLTWAVRTAPEPYSLSGAIQRELKSVSGGLATGRIRSMDDVVKHSTVRSDFVALLLTVFAAAALLLAAVGIHGLVAFSVQLRTRELGIRLALGATPDQIRKMVVKQAVWLAAAGVSVGVLASAGLARYMEALLYGTRPIEPAAIAAASLTLGLVAVLAAYIPARRASRLDPVDVLRSV
jgi:predicted permease